MRYTFNRIDIQLPHSPTFTSKHQFTIDYRFDTSGKENGKFEKKKKEKKKHDITIHVKRQYNFNNSLNKKIKS